MQRGTGRSSVDVFVPCYRYGRFLETCVRSILSQEGVDVRVLILDDASPDETESVGRALERADRRVEYRRHATNVGHIATYNEGIAWATAEYVQLLSADDVLTPGSLARITRVMDAHPDVTLGYGRDVTFSSELPAAVSPPRVAGHDIIEYRRFLAMSCELGHTPIQAPTAVVRNATQQAVGGFKPGHPHSGDTEIWLRLAARGSVAVVDAEQAFRRLHPASMSCEYSLLGRLDEHKRAFDEHLDEDCPLRDAAWFRRRIYATLAVQAFWLGARAFDHGDGQTCDAALEFASRLDPSLPSTSSWRRLGLKRRLGARVWGMLRPLSELASRTVLHARQ
jgi:glycosyltransferase involved in cell wall biosynthesis